MTPRRSGSCPRCSDVVPFVQGNAAVEASGRTRRTTVFGTGPGVPEVWQIKPALGRFLPDDEPRRARAFAVLGSKLRSELFGTRSPLGERIRVGGETYRIIGTMQPKGQMLGFDLDDTVYIPVARAMAMFDRDSLMEVDVLYHAGSDATELAAPDQGAADRPPRQRGLHASSPRTRCSRCSARCSRC